MSHFFTGTTGIQDVLPSDTPNSGRIKINENFDLIEEVFGEAIHGILSGHSITEGGTNINVVSGSTLGISTYEVNLNGNNNYARIGDGNTDIQLKGNINDATLDGGTF